MSLFYVMHLLQDIIRPTFAGLFHVVYAYNHFLDSVLFGAAYVHKIKFFATTGCCSSDMNSKMSLFFILLFATLTEICTLPTTGTDFFTVYTLCSCIHS